MLQKISRYGNDSGFPLCSSINFGQQLNKTCLNKNTFLWQLSWFGHFVRSSYLPPQWPKYRSEKACPVWTQGEIRNLLVGKICREFCRDFVSILGGENVVSTQDSLNLALVVAGWLQCCSPAKQEQNRGLFQWLASPPWPLVCTLESQHTEYQRLEFAFLLIFTSCTAAPSWYKWCW